MSIGGFERRLTSVLEAILCAGMLGIFLVIVVLVTMRYLFQSGLVGANEIATVAFAYLSSIGAAVAVGRQEHIRVDLLSRRVGGEGRKALAITSLSVVGMLNLAIVVTSLNWIATTGHYLMPASQIPRSVAQVCVPLGCGLATLYCFTRIAAILRGEPPN